MSINQKHFFRSKFTNGSFQRLTFTATQRYGSGPTRFPFWTLNVAVSHKVVDGQSRGGGHRVMTNPTVMTQAAA